MPLDRRINPEAPRTVFQVWVTVSAGLIGINRDVPRHVELLARSFESAHGDSLASVEGRANAYARSIVGTVHQYRPLNSDPEALDRFGVVESAIVRRVKR